MPVLVMTTGFSLHPFENILNYFKIYAQFYVLEKEETSAINLM